PSHLIHQYLPSFPTRRSSDLNRAVNVFRILGFSKQDRILKDLSASKVSQLINEMPPDDRTSFLSELKGDAVKHLIIMLSPSERKDRKSTRLNSSHVSISYAVF